MAYKVSGTSNDGGRVHVLQDGIYKGYDDISMGSYEVVFDGTTGSGTSVVAENSQGAVTGFGNLVALPTGDSSTITTLGGVMNSVQSFYIQIPDGFPKYADQTITEVDMSKTVLLFNGSHGYNDGTQPDRECCAYLEFLNSTTVRVHHDDHDAPTRVNFTVLEFGSGISSIQRGILSLASISTNTVSISSVDLSKTIVNQCGDAQSSTFLRDNGVRIYLQDATTLRAYRHSTSGTSNVSYEIIEFE